MPEILVRMLKETAIVVVLGMFSRLALGEEFDFESPSLDNFTFARIEFDSVGGWGEAYYGGRRGRRTARWQTDYPEADENFAYRLRQLTQLRPHAGAHTYRLSDPKLFDFPLIYMVDPGWMELTADEKSALREYLLRGGMLWVDDFWGDGEWANFERVMRDVLPEYSWREIPGDHPIFHMVFDFDALPYVPASWFARRWEAGEPPRIHRYPQGDLTHPELRGYFDQQARLMVVADHNTDLGDGWEREAYGQWYFENFSSKAYAMGVNIVIYAFTH
ncbi:MAG: DUF4159 domain-containing protein [Pseudomonadales bacterium]